MNNLKDKTVVITGGSRGIGLAIAKRVARDGARVVIMAKTDKPHPKLKGTIHSAVEEIEALGAEALAVKCDIRDEAEVSTAFAKAYCRFGSIDCLVNNASAISLTPVSKTDMKRFDLMHQVNGRGTYMCSKYAMAYFKKAENPHILTLSPPLNLNPKWFGDHLAYTMSKYAMSMVTLGLAEELKEVGIAVNSLWPETIIATAAIENMPKGEELVKLSRTPEIVAEAAYLILTMDSSVTGNFFIDSEVLKGKDLSGYAVDPAQEPMKDIYLD